MRILTDINLGTVFVQRDIESSTFIGFSIESNSLGEQEILLKLPDSADERLTFDELEKRLRP